VPSFITRALTLFEIYGGRGALCPLQAQKLKKSPGEIGLNFGKKNHVENAENSISELFH